MTAGRNEGLPERLHLLALGVLLHRPGVVAVGVDLACDLLVAGLDTPATVEVAGLRRDATLGDSEELLRSMLEEHGVQIPVPQTDADKFAALRLAFGFLNLPVSEFEGPFYERLPSGVNRIHSTVRSSSCSTSATTKPTLYGELR
jgi:hypothetical protein